MLKPALNHQKRALLEQCDSFASREVRTMRYDKPTPQAYTADTAQDEEVLHLPTIVDAAESSPAAAKEAATIIRKFLSKDNFSRAYVQYNAIMLIRILADNPGKTFTRNIDSKFVATVSTLLRDGRDMSVQQILRETLDNFQIQKSQDETLTSLITMWQTEKARYAKKGSAPQVPLMTGVPPSFPAQQSNYWARSHQHRGLPEAHELASRIEEAKTSGKLLLQVVQSTPPNEVFGNDLIKEFSERCQSASRSIQGYINADNPAPDEDTLLTLIETNDQLSMALSKYQRAMLSARRLTGASPAGGQPFPPPPPQNYPPPANAPPPNGLGNAVIPAGAPLLSEAPAGQVDPFADANGTNGAEASKPNLAQTTSQDSAYHPGYRPTPSYVNRQDSSANNLTMHGAAPVHEDDDMMESPQQERKYRF